MTRDDAEAAVVALVVKHPWAAWEFVLLYGRTLSPWAFHFLNAAIEHRLLETET